VVTAFDCKIAFHLFYFINIKKLKKMLKIGFILRGPLFLFLLAFSNLMHAQNEPTQTIRGRILDAVTNAPIPSASIVLSGKTDGIASDTEGSFRLEKIAVGRYELTAKCIGYQSITLQNIVLESGKETVLDLKMSASNTVLESLEVSSSTPSLSKLSRPETINMETLQRVPANFSDVGRMLTNIAGVASESDAANHFSVRGLSPNAMQWYLEGAEIVNPNHLSNAATQTDRATQNGGGVSIFSTNVVERADFYKGALPTDGGNALGAIVDVHFRVGNDEHQETTLGVGLIGFDFSTEGSFSKKSKASYLINYRYSTVGLLAKMGVPLGDEASAFQDVSFKMRFPTKKMGIFDVFGMGGISENVFVHKKRAEWLTQKDSQDITFKNQMGAIGASHLMRLGETKTVWESVVVLSGLQNSRLSVGYNSAETLVRFYDFKSINRKLYIKTRLNHQFKAGYLVAGVVIKNEFVDDNDFYQYDYLKNPNSQDSEKSGGQGMFYMPFADFSGNFGEKWSYSVGLRANHFTYINKTSIEPTAVLKRNLRDNESIKLSYSRQSQLMTPSFYFNPFWNSILTRADALDFIKSDNVNLTYNKQLTNDVQLTTSLFGQFYSNVYSYQYGNNYESWTLLDNLTPFGDYGLIGINGKAQTFGIEANIAQNHLKGWFWQFNTTLFDASFREVNATKSRSLEHNNRFIVNAYFGKEWTLGSRQNKFLGFGSRTILRGGNVQRLNADNFNTPELKQLKPYFRTDVNVYFKKNHRKWSSIVQLDIQNATNQENEQSYYYDRFLNKLTPQYQLGLLPNLSYKISF
jgi:hypothetical protein